VNPQSAIRNPQLSLTRSSLLAPRSSRSGLTLVELLITILIISILAGLILGVAALAGETAREAHSRHMVTRLHNLLMEHYRTYTTRRVRLRPQVEQAINALNISPAAKGQQLAEARLYALRELMLMEVPDRWSNVVLNQVGSAPFYPVYFPERTDLSNVYLRRYNNLVGRVNAITGSANTDAEIMANQSAECLYLVITLATGDGEARTLFGESTIGDTDGDGAPEFLDGWGHPIQFLRWAPGFDSLIQINANTLGTRPGKANDNPTWETAARADHDPFDVFRTDLGAFRLVPLIYSAGRDEELGIHDVPSAVVWRGIPVSSANFNIQSAPRLRPYEKIDDPSAGMVYLGTAIDGTATDNVHNHLLGLR
jgi:prepilin-type N-terminal cleavage/methylation domain-containing protein